MSMSRTMTVTISRLDDEEGEDDQAEDGVNEDVAFSTDPEAYKRASCQWHRS